VSRSVKVPQLELGLSNGARSGWSGFTAGLARQTIRRNVTINNLLPGTFDTDGQREHVRGMVDEKNTYEKIWHGRIAQNPAGRFGQAD
jgi:3-oxoacyl-[acyl-carrier protein] reductase